MATQLVRPIFTFYFKTEIRKPNRQISLILKLSKFFGFDILRYLSWLAFWLSLSNHFWRWKEQVAAAPSVFLFYKLLNKIIDAVPFLAGIQISSCRLRVLQKVDSVKDMLHRFILSFYKTPSPSISFQRHDTNISFMLGHGSKRYPTTEMSSLW